MKQELKGVRCHYVTQVKGVVRSMAGLNRNHKAVEQEIPICYKHTRLKEPVHRRRGKVQFSTVVVWALVSTVLLHRNSFENEQNIEIVQGQLQLKFFELVQVQIQAAPRRSESSGGHPQTPRDGGNVDQEAGLPGEEDRTGANDSQETRHQKQER